MTQEVVYLAGGRIVRRRLPDPDAVVLDGVLWGQYERIFTPAYWVSQVWMHRLDDPGASPFHSRRPLEDEVVFCMLSGFGVRAEVARAAFLACRDQGLIASRCTDPGRWSRVLGQPLVVNGKMVRYRYPNQKARYLADAMTKLQGGAIDTRSGRALRDSLLRIKGCGRKTAGFIARNHLDTDEVAILDIHVVRAGLLMDVFSPGDRVERDYDRMEVRFIDFCQAAGVRPATLDSVIWQQMRDMGGYALDAVRYKCGVGESPMTSAAL